MFGKNAKEYNSWEERKEYMDEMPYNLKVVNTGSTAGFRAFDYQYWDISGFNLGWQPQTLYYDFEILKKIANHIEKKAKVFICIEEFKLLVDHYANPNATLKYYFILEPEQICGYDNIIGKKLKSIPFLVKKSLLKSEITAFIKKILHYKIKTPVFKNSDEKDVFYSNYYLNMWYKEFGWEKTKPTLSQKQADSIEINSQRLKDMLLYCIEQEWEPIVVIVPFSPNISDKLPDNILDECLWEPLDKIKKCGYKVLDLFHDERLHDCKLYEDGISLNDKGKALFNEIVQAASSGGVTEEKKYD